VHQRQRASEHTQRVMPSATLSNAEMVEVPVIPTFTDAAAPIATVLLEAR
jgi:hypothetical protein